MVRCSGTRPDGAVCGGEADDVHVLWVGDGWHTVGYCAYHDRIPPHGRSWVRMDADEYEAWAVLNE